LVEALRAASPPVVARWLHRGLTSQDVLDTALVLCLRDAAGRVLEALQAQARRLAELAQTHRDTVAPGRTLGRPAVPTTFGLTAAGWLAGVLDAAADLDLAVRQLPVQVGGATGTLAGVGELLGDPQRAVAAADRMAGMVGLRASPPWHTQRRPLTRLADALVACTDAWGHIVNDVLLRSRPEVGELAERSVAGRGGSSTLPGKENPVLAVLIRRAALSGPGLAAQVHVAAASVVDERPDGAWHAEWEPLREAVLLTAGAVVRTRDVLEHLVVHPDAMAANLERTDGLVFAEQLAAALAPALGRAEAGDLVAGLSERAAAEGRSLPAVAAADEQVSAVLPGGALAAVFDARGALGSTDAFIDRARAAWAAERERASPSVASP
jgi:3-carboxy-cis,cis-muconate cycloisomerase